ncbi:MAG: hypothetical protein E7616_02570 [Ruminococcaceae bacterium]|nr:hypothetical protein [Oscillospiraceae bacterium]
MKKLLSKFTFTGEYLLSVMAGLALGVVGYGFVESAVGYKNYLAVRISGIIWYLFTVCLLIGLKSAHIAYKQKKNNFKEAFLSVLPVFILQLILGSILGFPMYTVGAGFHFGLLLYAGEKEVAWFPDVPYLYYFIGTLLTFAICLLALAAGQKFGYKKRIKDRNKLLST